LPEKGQLKIQIFNIRGERICTLVDEVRLAGPGSVQWDGTDALGNTVAAGVYFYEARAGSNAEIGKMVLVK